MNRNSKKGFTIVELIIVIAVIAVLAAVLIPTFSNLIQKANEAKDTALVSNLNKAVAMDNGSKETVYDVLKVAEDIAGINVAKINAAANSNEILWDSTNKCFVYSVNGEIKYIPDSKTKDVAGDYDYWKLSSNQEDVKANKYSIYWTGAALSEITATTGFDAGEAEIAEVKYDRQNESVGRKVTIRTNGGKLTVNAPQDTVAHYGKASGVQITAVYGNSYHEYGEVVGDIVITKGRIELAATAQVGTVLVASEKANDVKVDVVSGAQVGTVAPTTEAAQEDVKASATIPTESKQTEIVPENKDFAGGLGTERSPYLIANAQQFVNIKTLAKEMEEKAYAFKLTADIDLSTVNTGNYISYTFNGILDGAEHSLTLNPAQIYLFAYAVDNVTIKNLNYVLNGSVAAPMFMRYGTKAISYDSSSNQYTTSNETVKLMIENVKITSVDQNYFQFRSNNYGLITSCQSYVQLFDSLAVGGTAGGSDGSYYAYTSETTNCHTLTTIENCEVSVNLLGSTGKYNAVLLGGQIMDNTVVVADCEYSGTFIGYEIGVVFSNYNACEDAKITIDNVKLTGELLHENCAGITFANNTAEVGTVKNEGIMSKLTKDATMALELNNNRYTLKAATDSNVVRYTLYVKLSAVKLTDSTYTNNYGETSVLGIEIEVVPGELDIYKAKNVTKKQAEAKGITLSETWKTSLDGYKYQFAEKDGQWYIVVDFEAKGMYREFKNQDYTISAYVYGYNDSGKLIHISDVK